MNSLLLIILLFSFGTPWMAAAQAGASRGSKIWGDVSDQRPQPPRSTNLELTQGDQAVFKIEGEDKNSEYLCVCSTYVQTKSTDGRDARRGEFGLKTVMIPAGEVERYVYAYPGEDSCRAFQASRNHMASQQRTATQNNPGPVYFHGRDEEDARYVGTTPYFNCEKIPVYRHFDRYHQERDEIR